MGIDEFSYDSLYAIMQTAINDNINNSKVYYTIKKEKLISKVLNSNEFENYLNYHVHSLSNLIWFYKNKKTDEDKKILEQKFNDEIKRIIFYLENIDLENYFEF